jgi:acyl-CoA hydrolase
MENFKLVLPEHLNHYGYLFGGNLLKWVDESAYIAARRRYPSLELVTVSMNRVEFRQRVELGSILVFEVGEAQVGITSLTYPVKVFLAAAPSSAGPPVFTTTVTYVSIDEAGNKRPLPPRS